MDIAGTFTNLKFLLKLINLILVLICLIMWIIPKDDKYTEIFKNNGGFYGHDNGMDPRKFSQIALFAFTVPAYVIILLVWVIAFLLGEEPEKWTSRLVLLTGAVLFFVTSVISFINYSDGYCGEVALETLCIQDFFGTTAIINGILCVVVSVLMIVDILKTENVF